MLSSLARLHTQQRALWTCATSTDADLAAALSACASKLAPHSPTTCLMLASQSYPAQALEHAARSLKASLPSSRILGTVVDHVLSATGTATPGVALLGHAGPSEHFCIGDEHGRSRLRQASVGRWHNASTNQRIPNPQDTWTPGASITQPPSHVTLPRLRDASLVVFFADREHDQVTRLLDSRFPNARRIGVIGARTPFVNGREFTLFDGTSVRDNGVLCAAFDADTSAALDYNIDYITGCHRVVRARGNVILELTDGQLAHDTIASARRTPLFAEISDVHGNSAVCQVTGGDPARELAIDTTKDVREGHVVRFCAARERALSVPAEAPAIAFAAAELAQAPNDAGAAGAAGAVGSVFGAVTEGGFVYGAPGQGGGDEQSVLVGAAQCTVPGSSVVLRL